MKPNNIPIAKKLFKDIETREILIERLGEKSEVRIFNAEAYRGEITTGLTEDAWAILTKKVRNILQQELEQAKIELIKLD